MNQFNEGDRIVCKYSDVSNWIYKVLKFEKREKRGFYRLESPSGSIFECQQENTEDVCELYEKGSKRCTN